MQFKFFVVFSLVSVVALVSAAPVDIPKLDAVLTDSQTEVVEAREPSPGCNGRWGGCF